MIKIAMPFIFLFLCILPKVRKKYCEPCTEIVAFGESQKSKSGNFTRIFAKIANIFPERKIKSAIISCGKKAPYFQSPHFTRIRNLAKNNSLFCRVIVAKTAIHC